MVRVSLCYTPMICLTYDRFVYQGESLTHTTTVVIRPWTINHQTLVSNIIDHRSAYKFHSSSEQRVCFCLPPSSTNHFVQGSEWIINANMMSSRPFNHWMTKKLLNRICVSCWVAQHERTSSWSYCCRALCSFELLITVHLLDSRFIISWLFHHESSRCVLDDERSERQPSLFSICNHLSSQCLYVLYLHYWCWELMLTTLRIRQKVQQLQVRPQMLP